MPASIAQTNDKLAIMTVHEVAQYLRISEAKVYRLVKERAIPMVRIGKTWCFRRDLLDDWYQEHLCATYPSLVVPGPFPWPETLARANPLRAVCTVEYANSTEITCSPDEPQR